MKYNEELNFCDYIKLLDEEKEIIDIKIVKDFEILFTEEYKNECILKERDKKLTDLGI